jgi:prepilin-type N-terminal cleavage/methylation domain-containing protein
MKTPNSSRGFTLIEILTAAVLSGMLLGVFMLITVKFVGLFDRLRGGDARIEDIATRALDMIEDDLSASHIDSKFYQYECLAYWDHPSHAISELGTIKNSGYNSDITESFTPEKSGLLLFFSKTLNRTGVQKGDVQALAYRLAYQDPIAYMDSNSDYKTFNLYRIANSPGRTLDMINQRDLASLWKGGGGQPSVVSPAVSDRPYFINDLDPEFLVARNVVDFRVTFLCSCIVTEDNDEERFFPLPPRPSNSSPLPANFAKLRIGGNRATNETSFYTGLLPSLVPQDIRVYPSAAEVSLTILSDEGMKRMRALERTDRNNSKSSLNRFVEEHGRTYTRTVKIQPKI